MHIEVAMHRAALILGDAVQNSALPGLTLTAQGLAQNLNISASTVCPCSTFPGLCSSVARRNWAPQADSMPTCCAYRKLSHLLMGSFTEKAIAQMPALPKLYDRFLFSLCSEEDQKQRRQCLTCDNVRRMCLSRRYRCPAPTS